jgi:hypothetical protein
MDRVALAGLLPPGLPHHTNVRSHHNPVLAEDAGKMALHSRRSVVHDGAFHPVPPEPSPSARQARMPVVRPRFQPVGGRSHHVRRSKSVPLLPRSGEQMNRQKRAIASSHGRHLVPPWQGRACAGAGNGREQIPPESRKNLSFHKTSSCPCRAHYDRASGRSYGVPNPSYSGGQ